MADLSQAVGVLLAERRDSRRIPGEEPLIERYSRLLDRNANRAAANYRRIFDATVAAGELDDILNEDQLSEESKKALKAARDQLAREAAVAQAVQFGISFAVTSPYLKQLLEAHAGKQAERLVAGARDVVTRVLAESLEEGWSVPQTATAIREKLLELKKWQATMLARTDLISLKNGGSFAAALQLAESQPVYKQWVSARDDKVRPSHVEANGQVVKLDSPFQVGEARLSYPGDPEGPDGEVINCRCTQIYSDSPMAAVWTVTGAGAWDESEHPRDPGGEGGGEFIKKGAIESFADVPKHMMSGITSKALAALEEKRAEIEALPVPDPGDAGYRWGLENTIEISNGLQVVRSSDGLWHLTGASVDGVLAGRGTVDELFGLAEEHLAAKALQGEANWKASLRGHTFTRRNQPVVMGQFREAQAYNDSSPEWREFADRYGLDEAPIVLNEEGTKRMGKDLFTSGWYDPNLDRVFISGDMWVMKEKLRSDLSSVLSERPAVGPITGPDDSASSTIPGLLRHEYAHQAWSRLSQRQRDAFIAMTPTDKETLNQLSRYAAASEEYYNGRVFDGIYPWQGEVWSEAVATTTDKAYRRESWPDWVNQMGDWIKSQERE